MDNTRETARIIGVAKIRAYAVTFESVSYVIAVSEGVIETPDRVDSIADYEINMVVPFTEDRNVLYWLRNPAFIAMQESWVSGENDCYFEHTTNDRAALMTLSGSVVLVPVVNL
jgi:hypothetical protein